MTQPATKANILYVEDDESLSFVTRDNLELQGYRITHCSDGKKAREAFQNGQFDLCIMDVMLPEIDGFTLVREFRQIDDQVPIIFLSAKSLKEDRLQGLKIGGDDYLTKPFSIEELLLKIEIFLRRRNITQPRTTDTYQVGTFHFDYPNLTLRRENDTKSLTQKEADLLLYFASHKNQVLKRPDILEELWGENDYFMGRSLDVFISRLRKYLAPDPQVRIENIHGVGFRLRCPA